MAHSWEWSRSQPEGLKSVYKDFNLAGEALAERLRVFRQHGVHVLASFIFGLPTDTADTFEATAALALSADVAFAQFVLLQPFPGTVDFERWERSQTNPPTIDDVPLTRHWLLPTARRPRCTCPTRHLAPEQIRNYTQAVWDQLLQPARHLEARPVRQDTEGKTGVRAHFEALPPDVRKHGHCDRQRTTHRAKRMARLIAWPCRRFFVAPVRAT